jgi:hypothetical protein
VELVVEKEEAGGIAGLDGECSKGVVFFVELQHASEIYGAENVDVVEYEGFVYLLGTRAIRIFEEEPGGFFEPATGVEQEIVFAGNFNAHAEIVAGLEVVDDHVREVMDVDDDFGDAELAKARESDFEQ